MQDSKDVKIFGLALTIILSLLSIKTFKMGKLLYKNTTFIALLFFFVSIFVPRLILPIFKTFRVFGTIVGWLVSNIVLILIFYLVFTPIGLFLKLIGKDLLNLKKTDTASYWIKKQEVFLKDRYKKQF